MASEPPAESLPPEEHGKFLSGYGAKRVFFSYHRCPQCALLYCPVYYSAAQLSQLYGHQAENMAEVPLASRLRTQEHYVELAGPETLPEGDYLELGADIGLFASRCAARKRFGKFWLYEPNRDVQAELRSRMGAARQEIVEKPFADGDVPARSLSLAVGVHVVDHIWEPLAMFKALHKALKPGGRVLVVTHDERSLLARVLGRRFPPYALQHPQLYSAASLRALAERAGFQDVRTIKTLNYFPVTHLARAALQVLNLPSGFLPSWPGAALGLKLGNIATVATRGAA